MADKLRWGILGTGRIAKALARAINASSTSTLVAVGSRTQESADKFGAEFSVPHRYGSYEKVLSDGDVDAVYISLPNDLHAPWTIKAAHAGKHILCEKPLAMNFPEAMVMLEEVRRAGVFLLEAFMYRCHPQTAKLVELIRAKTIGEVRMIHANFSYNAGERWQDIRMQNAMGGGGIMDVGCYTASMARLIAGAAIGGEQPFADPLDIKGIAYIGPESRCDEWAVASVKFPKDILAQLSCGMRVGLESVVRVYGSAGSIHVPNPWFPGDKDNKITINKAGDPQPQTVLVEPGVALYTIEVDTVAKAVADKKTQAATTAMTWADSLSNMKMLDWWRKSVGLAWDTEKTEALAGNTYAGRKLAVIPSQNKMTYGQVPGVDKPVSRVVMGSMIFNNSEIPLTFAMLDHFFEVGGNCIDTAYVYGGGQSEQAVGTWVKTRGNRKDVVIIGKGAHTPHCDPASATRQLHETLGRLQTDYVDIYFLHRDNLDVPVKEFVDVLNEHVKAGRIRAFGGSNWTTQRIQEANDYAASKGLVGFTVNSPNLSLARWNHPTWAGCITASDPESRAWHTKTQVSLFSWSSQANGFFTGRYKRGDNPQSADWAVGLVAPVWFNDGNFKRLERAQELAARKGVTSTQIAMAYVLSQPFPTYALIGPRTIDETRTSIEGAGLQLTPDELKWLALED